jgi:hypothetical protein
MTVAEAASLLGAKFVLLEVHQEACATIRAVCTDNQRALIDRLPDSHRIRALRSIANQHVSAQAVTLLQTLRKDHPDNG